MKGNIIGISLLFLFGCTNLTNKNSTKEIITIEKNSIPQWFFNPTMDIYKYGGVGVSGRSTKGLSGQREIAIAKAINEIAMQMGVKVDSIVKTSQVNTGTEYESYSFQTTNGQIVSARLMEIWYDREKERVYAWLVVIN